MRQFVQFIKDLKYGGKWDVVAELDLENYRRCVPENMPKFLGSFLKDKGGWIFTTNVAGCLSQLERGLISHKQISSLPSYRPGFWNDFFNLYEGRSLHYFRKDEAQFEVTSALPSDPPFMYWEASHKSPSYVTTDDVSMLPLPKLVIGKGTRYSSHSMQQRHAVGGV